MGAFKELLSMWFQIVSILLMGISAFAAVSGITIGIILLVVFMVEQIS